MYLHCAGGWIIALPSVIQASHGATKSLLHTFPVPHENVKPKIVTTFGLFASHVQSFGHMHLINRFSLKSNNLCVFSLTIHKLHTNCYKFDQ